MAPAYAVYLPHASTLNLIFSTRNLRLETLKSG